MVLRKTRACSTNNICLLVLIAVVCCLAPFAQTRADDPPGLDEIKAHWAQARKHVESLFVEFKHEAVTPLQPAELVSLPAFARQIYLPKEEVRWAFHGKRRYMRTVQPAQVARLQPRGRPKPRADASDHEKAVVKELQDQYDRAQHQIARAQRMGMKLQEQDPDSIELDIHTVRAFNGKLQWSRTVRRPGEKGQVFVHFADNSRHWFQPDRYLGNAGWGVADPTEADADFGRMQRSALLPDALDLAPYSVAPQSETISGVECVVLTGTVRHTTNVGEETFVHEVQDKIWLDLGHGLAVRRRELHMDGMRQRTDNSDFVEILDGVWLPRKSVSTDFAPADVPEPLRGKPVMHWQYELVRWVVNEVPDDLFDLTVEPGDHVEDMRANPTGTVPPRPKK